VKGSCCALCASDKGPFVQRPFGRDDALVTVCNACDTEPPVYRRGPDAAYDPSSQFTVAQFKAAVDTYARNVGVPKSTYGRDLTTVRDLSPGCVVHRVRILKGRRTRDHVEARRDFRSKPWANEARYLGIAGIYHLYERPQ
jgi:hypothetical protein